MPEKRNDFTATVLNVVETIRREREAAEKANPVPFMEERMSMRDARTRWEHMPAGERRAFIREHGVDAALKLVRPPKVGGFVGADGVSLKPAQEE